MSGLRYSLKLPSSRQTAQGMALVLAKQANTEIGNFRRNPFRARAILLPDIVVTRSCGMTASLRGAEEGPHVCGDLTPVAAKTHMVKAMSHPPAVASPLHGAPALRLEWVLRSPRRLKKQNSHERNLLMTHAEVP